MKRHKQERFEAQASCDIFRLNVEDKLHPPLRRLGRTLPSDLAKHVQVGTEHAQGVAMLVQFAEGDVA